MIDLPDAPTWRDSYDVYIADCEREFDSKSDDPEWIAERKALYPRGLNIRMSLEKAFITFWGTTEGWKWCKVHRKTKKLNWNLCVNNCLNNRNNRVWFEKGKPDMEAVEIDRKRSP